MIDIHAHILPDLDDGSEDMEESLEMAELAVESGVEIMTATPHSNQMGRFENFQSEQLQTAFERLRMVLKKEKSPLKILNGHTVMEACITKRMECICICRGIRQSHQVLLRR